jgi:glycosyltransferase involved in cell wall biosynthesis
MHDPLVSVIIAVYNDAKRLPRSVESVKAQSVSDWEIVIADDGSTDDSLTVANQLASEDPRVRVVPIAHGGVARARNAAARVARGKWLAIQDSDDYSHPDRLERQVAVAERYPSVGVVGSFGQRVSSSGRRLGVVPQGPTTIDAFRMLRLTTPTYVINGTALIRRDLFVEVGGYPEDYVVSEDLALYSLRLASRCDILVIPEALVSIEMHQDSLSRSRAKEIVEADDVIRLNLARIARGEPTLGYRDSLAELSRQPLIKVLLRQRRELRHRWLAQGIALLVARSPRALGPLALATLVAPVWTMKHVISRIPALASR